MRLFYAAALCLGVATAGSSAHAETCKMTGSDISSLNATIKGFSAAMRQGDWRSIQDVVPRRIIQKMASDAGASPQAVVDEMTRIMARAMQTVTLEAFNMSTSKVGCEMAGGVMKIVQVPTEMIVAIEGGGRHAMKSHTLAMQDGNQWYLLRVSEPQELMVLTDLYPELAATEFPPGQMTPLQ